jgi:hypothetical protein
MRLIVLALMIVLLPLRALAGDVMATHMASSVAAMETGAARAHETGASGSFGHQKQPFETPAAMADCHEQTESHHNAADKTNSLSSQTSDHCNTCAACQACHTVALSPNAPGDMALFASPQLRHTSIAAFTSADAALGQKPPIS